MPLDSSRVASLLALVRRRYPDWDDLSHPLFAAEQLSLIHISEPTRPY